MDVIVVLRADAANKTKLWSADLVLASIVNFCLAFVFYSLMTTMALYAVDRFAVSDTAGGLASSIFVVGGTAARLFAGNLVDLVGKRQILVISLVVFVLASSGYFLVESSFGALLAVRFAHGVAFAMASTAAMALAQSVIPRARMAEGTGYFTLSMTLATAVGPFLALELVAGPGYEALFAAGSIAAVLAMVLALFLRTNDAVLESEQRAKLKRFHPRDMLHPAVLPVACFMLILAICYSGVLTYLGAFAGERGLQSGASIFFLVYAAVLLVTRFVAGRVQDQHGDNIIVYAAVGAFAVGLAVLAFARTDFVLVLAGAAMGMGFGTLMSALQSVAVSKVPMNRIGVAISTHYFMVDLGIGIGPILLGLVISLTGFGPMYAILSAVVLSSSVIYHLVHGRRGGRRAPITLPDREIEHAH